ncbi:MAG: hypothetical protein AAGA28_06210 [Pseudomonadota bacterium]
MQTLLSGLVAFHKLAEPNGDGLVPELLALAQRDQTHARNGAVPLPVQSWSSGPAQGGPARQSHAACDVSILNAGARTKKTAAS